MPISAVLGPYVRGVWSTGANFWAELDRPCVVRIQHALEGTNDWHTAEARTVQVDQRHYAMVTATGLRPGAWYTWRGVVQADGATAQLAEHRLAGLRGLLFRTLDDRGWTSNYRFAHASCRKARHADESKGGGPGPDILDLFADWLAANSRQRERDWPRFLLLTGDQIYADECDDFIIERILEKRRRSGNPQRLPSLSNLHPTSERAGRRGVHPTDFEEYAIVYASSWKFSGVEQVLANLPTFMMLDDHEFTDDWNITLAWQQQARRGPWRNAMVAALGAYWIYQGWANLDPERLKDDPRHNLLREAASSGFDAWPLLSQLLNTSIESPQTLHWYYEIHTPFPLRVADTRTERVIPSGANFEAQRSAQIMSSTQLQWLTEPLQRTAPWGFVVTPGPFLVWPLIAVAGAAFRLGRGNDSPSLLGRILGAGVALVARNVLSASTREKLLRDLPDLEFWPVFLRSYSQIVELARRLEGQNRTLIFLTGDVHSAFNMAARPSGSRLKNTNRYPPVLQFVGSSLQNPITGTKRTLVERLGAQARQGSFEGLDFGYVPFESGDFFFDNNIALIDLMKDGRGVWLREMYLTAGRDGKLTNSHTLRPFASPLRNPVL